MGLIALALVLVFGNVTALNEDTAVISMQLKSSKQASRNIHASIPEGVLDEQYALIIIVDEGDEEVPAARFDPDFPT